MGCRQRVHEAREYLVLLDLRSDLFQGVEARAQAIGMNLPLILAQRPEPNIVTTDA